MPGWLITVLKIWPRLCTVATCLTCADNPHDANAVMIFWHHNKIGYVPSEYTDDLQKLLSHHSNLCGKIVEIDRHSEDHRWVKFNIYPSRENL